MWAGHAARKAHPRRNAHPTRQAHPRLLGHDAVLVFLCEQSLRRDTERLQLATVAMNQWLAHLGMRLARSNRTGQDRDAGASCPSKGASRTWLSTGPSPRKEAATAAAAAGACGAARIGWRAISLVCQVEDPTVQHSSDVLVRAPAHLGLGAGPDGVTCALAARTQSDEKRILIFRVRPKTAPLDQAILRAPQHQSSGHRQEDGQSVSARHEDAVAFYTCTSASDRSAVAAGSGSRGDSERCLDLRVHKDVERWWPSCGDVGVDALLLLVGSGCPSPGTCKKAEIGGYQRQGRPVATRRSAGMARGQQRDGVCLPLQPAARLDALSLADAHRPFAAHAFPSPFVSGDKSAHTYEGECVSGSSAELARHAAPTASLSRTSALPLARPGNSGGKGPPDAAIMSWTLRYGGMPNGACSTCPPAPSFCQLRLTSSLL